MVDNRTYWDHVQPLQTRAYTCGYFQCGKEIGADRGWVHKHLGGQVDGLMYICPYCKRPTFFDGSMQYPGVSLGNNVKHLPPEIEPIWTEIRSCTGHGAFTAAVLVGRKLLMHIAVDQGAKAGLPFTQYVDFLVDNHFSPPNSKNWVDKIRTHGNEATHELLIKTQVEADDILTFLEMLLKFIYEFPGRVP